MYFQQEPAVIKGSARDASEVWRWLRASGFTLLPVGLMSGVAPAWSEHSGWQAPRQIRESPTASACRAGARDKIIFYAEANHRFTYQRTFSWQSNEVTRAVANGLRALGGEPNDVFRPMWLENPKQV